VRIGFTYDLRDDYRALGYGEEETAEFDSAETVDAVAGALAGLGHEVVRIGHIRELVRRLAAGERWDMAFNIAEGLAGRSREAQVPALLEAYGIPCTFADPLVLALTLDKAMAKRVVRDRGIPTAPFAVLAGEDDLAALDLAYPLFLKPLAEGTGKGCDGRSRVEAAGELHAAWRRLAERFRQPVLAETFLSGREFTVGIVGSGAAAEVVANMEIVLLANAEPGVYSFTNKELCEDRVHYRLADDAEARAAAAVALAAYRALECRDAGRVDIRSDGRGRPHFLEVNPLAGLHPSHSDLPILCNLAGRSYEWLIGRIVAECAERSGLRGAGARQAAA